METNAWIILLCLCASTVLDCDALDLESAPLSPDGLLVENLGTVRATAGLWRIWVTLDLPFIPDVLVRDIANMKTFVSRVNHT